MTQKISSLLSWKVMTDASNSTAFGMRSRDHMNARMVNEYHDKEDCWR
jgi:hypothetical protein